MVGTVAAGYGREMREARPDAPPRRRAWVLDATWAERVVAEHLARYACTRAHLRTLLDGRIRRALLKGATVQDGLPATIESVLDRHEALGTLNDAAWAEARARALTRRGMASAVVRQRLREKGVTDTRAALDAVVDELGVDNGAAADLVAACAWMRRKRAGPYQREPVADRAAEQKVLAAMGRAGFGFDLARRALRLTRDEADEQLAHWRG